MPDDGGSRPRSTRRRRPWQISVGRVARHLEIWPRPMPPKTAWPNPPRTARTPPTTGGTAGSAAAQRSRCATGGDHANGISSQRDLATQGTGAGSAGAPQWLRAVGRIAAGTLRCSSTDTSDRSAVTTRQVAARMRLADAEWRGHEASGLIIPDVSSRRELAGRPVPLQPALHGADGVLAADRREHLEGVLGSGSSAYVTVASDFSRRASTKARAWCTGARVSLPSVDHEEVGRVLADVGQRRGLDEVVEVGPRGPCGRSAGRGTGLSCRWPTASR